VVVTCKWIWLHVYMSLLWLKDRDNISQGQFQALDEYYQRKYGYSLTDQQTRMNVAEKTALSIAVAKNAGLNVSLTTNASFFNSFLNFLTIYRYLLHRAKSPSLYCYFQKATLANAFYF